MIYASNIFQKRNKMIQPKIKINNKSEIKRERIVTGFILLVVAFAIFVLFFTAKSISLPQKTIPEQASTLAQSNFMQKLSTMSMTAYDKELAIKFMDKDNDGKCDVCGMDVEICMDSGQLQCSMDSESIIGVLGSQHIHTDWKVYINGEVLDFTGKDHMTGIRSGSSVSSFIHVDSGAPAPEKTGDILHMHAKGVPLWIFFDSIKLKLPESAKVYVNGELNSDGLNYVFNDLDKILITDGQGDFDQQLSSMTDFAKIH